MNYTEDKNKDLNSNDEKPMLGEVKDVEIQYNTMFGNYKSFVINKRQMSEIKINDFWSWLNRYIPNNESLKLLEIVDCDYKRIMIKQYSKI